jgi:uncharacterized protein YjbI with pentapeptide repeats
LTGEIWLKTEKNFGSLIFSVRDLSSVNSPIVIFPQFQQNGRVLLKPTFLEVILQVQIWKGLTLGGANLTGVNFKSAVLKHANFENAIVDGANFLNVNLNMVKKLKLSESQQREIEEAKQAERERAAADLAARKAKKETESNQ